MIVYLSIKCWTTFQILFKNRIMHFIAKFNSNNDKIIIINDVIVVQYLAFNNVLTYCIELKNVLCKVFYF